MEQWTGLAMDSTTIMMTVEDARLVLSCSWKMMEGIRKISISTAHMMEKCAIKSQEMFQKAGL